MALQKVVYKDNETVITAENLNDIQDAVISAQQDVEALKNQVSNIIEALYVTYNDEGVFTCDSSYGELREAIVEEKLTVGIFTNTDSGITEQLHAELHDEDGEIWFYGANGAYIFYASGGWEYDPNASGGSGGGGSSGGGTWEKLCSITTEEEVSSITYAIDADCKEVFVTAGGYYGTKGTISAMDFTDTFKLCQSSSWFYDNNARYTMGYFKLVNDFIFGVYANAAIQKASTTEMTSTAGICKSHRNPIVNGFGNFNIWTQGGTFKAGFNVEIWGLKS